MTSFWRQYFGVFNQFFNVHATSLFRRHFDVVILTSVWRRHFNVDSTSEFQRRNDVGVSSSFRRRYLNVDSICIFDHFFDVVSRRRVTSFRRWTDVILPTGMLKYSVFTNLQLCVFFSDVRHLLVYKTNRTLVFCLCAVIETWMTPFNWKKSWKHSAPPRVFTRHFLRFKWRHSCLCHSTETRKECSFY